LLLQLWEEDLLRFQLRLQTFFEEMLGLKEIYEEQEVVMF
jgi:hypothetical protein